MSSLRNRAVISQRSRPLSPQLVEKSIEWFGFLAGVAGAITLALNVPWSGYGWYAFLGSNFAWLAFSAKRRIWTLLLMQVVFTTTSFVGIYRWLATDQQQENKETSCTLTQKAE